MEISEYSTLLFREKGAYYFVNTNTKIYIGVGSWPALVLYSEFLLHYHACVAIFQVR